jgi:O-antigen/teichoic acid export membrane protein
MLSKLKTLASDTAIYGTFTIIGRFLTFLLTPLYTNYLLVPEVGDVSYLFSLIAFINIFYTFGMESSFMRFYKAGDYEANCKAFTLSYLTIASVSALLSLTVFIFADQIAATLPDLRGGATLIRYASLIPFLEAIVKVPLGLLRMVRNAKRFSYTRVYVILLAVALNVLFVAIIPMGAKGVIIAQVLANLFGVILYLPELVKYMRFKFDRTLLMEMLRFGLPTLPASLSAIVLQIADRPILKAMTNSSEVAMYTVNYRLGIPMMLLVSIFEYAWKPFYLTHYEDEEHERLFSRVLTYFTLFSGIFFLLVGFFMEFLVRMPFIGGKFINPEYWSGMGIIPIILGGYYFNGMFTNFSAGFHIKKKTEYLPLTIGLAAIVNVVMNIVLIPYYGIYGAAWATFVAYLVSAIAAFLYTLKIYPLKYEWKRVFLIIASTMIVYVSAMWLTNGMRLGTTFSIRLAAVGVFGILLWLFKFFTPAEIRGIRKIFLRK